MTTLKFGGFWQLTGSISWNLVTGKLYAISLSAIVAKIIYYWTFLLLSLGAHLRRYIKKPFILLSLEITRLTTRQTDRVKGLVMLPLLRAAFNKSFYSKKPFILLSRNRAGPTISWQPEGQTGLKGWSCCHFCVRLQAGSTPEQLDCNKSSLKLEYC